MRTSSRALTALVAVFTAHADAPLGAWTAVTLENDLVVRTDRHYTHGSKVTQLLGERTADDVDSRVARLARRLPSMGLRSGYVRWGVSLGQNIFTPDDIVATALITTDRPYAGYTYSSWHMFRRGDRGGGTAPTLDAWTLDLGIVGPGSGAEQAQNEVHRIRNYQQALGWGNQLRNEPAINLRYSRTFRFSAGTPGSWESQFLPHYAGTAGTVFTDASAGAQIRLGWNLPEDYGRRTIGDPMTGVGGRVQGAQARWSFHFFVGGEGRLVGWNMLLDGNIYHDSHSVRKKPVIGEFKVGAALCYGRFDLSLAQVVRSREYSLQPSVDSNGSLTLGYRW